MSDVSPALPQDTAQVRERQPLGDLKSPGRQGTGQTLQTVTFGCTTHQHELKISTGGQVSDEDGPLVLWPILALAPAARVEGEPALGRTFPHWRTVFPQGLQEVIVRIGCLARQLEFRNRVRIKYSQTL